MKKIKTITIVGSLIIAGALTVGAISAFANDPLTSNTQSTSAAIQENKKLDKHSLVDVNGEKITNVDLLNYKAYKKVENAQVSDQELLEDMITEKLYLQLANEKNVAATLEDGKKMAEENRNSLANQSQEVQDIQQKLIAAMGMTEEQYWNEFVPAEYQKIITMQNLSQLLIKENVLQYNGEDPNEYAEQLRNYKHQLYEQAKNKKVKVLDNSISLR